MSGKAWKDEIQPVLKNHGKVREVLISGYSIGGAVAAYITQRLLHNSKMKKSPVRLIAALQLLPRVFPLEGCD